MAEMAKQVGEHVYVDDSAIGEYMVSRQDDDSDGFLSQVLSSFGLKVKFSIITGDPDPQAMAILGGKVLGLRYELKEDMMSFCIEMKYKVPGNFKEKQMLSLDVEKVKGLLSNMFRWTRRNALSFLMQVYDPP